MSYDDIRTATVIRYPYVWAEQALAGEIEGRKQRPAAVGVRIARRDNDLVVLFPITTKRPHTSRFFVEIPAIEKRRAGLEAGRPIWLVLDEFNTDLVGQSFYLEPEPPLGRFSKAFFLPLLREFIARRKAFTEVRRFR